MDAILTPRKNLPHYICEFTKLLFNKLNNETQSIRLIDSGLQKGDPIQCLRNAFVNYGAMDHLARAPSGCNTDIYNSLYFSAHSTNKSASPAVVMAEQLQALLAPLNDYLEERGIAERFTVRTFSEVTVQGLSLSRIEGVFPEDVPHYLEENLKNIQPDDLLLDISPLLKHPTLIPVLNERLASIASPKSETISVPKTTRRGFGKAVGAALLGGGLAGTIHGVNTLTTQKNSSVTPAVEIGLSLLSSLAGGYLLAPDNKENPAEAKLALLYRSLYDQIGHGPPIPEISHTPHSHMKPAKEGYTL